jgi:hypothetical protein
MVCNDPRPEDFRRPPEDLPAMECTHAYDRIGCGYACEYGRGEVKCARSPDGMCSLDPSGAVVCFDPPPPPPP